MNAPAKIVARMSRNAPVPAAPQPPTIDYAAMVRTAAAPLHDVRFAERAYAPFACKSGYFSEDEANRMCREWVPGKGDVMTMASLTRYETTIRDILVLLPEISDIVAAGKRIAAAVEEHANEAHFALFAGILNDAFRTKSGEEAAVYSDMLATTFEFLPEADDDTKPIKGMPVAAVAAAVLELCASQVFRPAISEVVEKSRGHRNRLGNALWCLRRMRNAIVFAERWLDGVEVMRPFAADYFENKQPDDGFDAWIEGQEGVATSDKQEGRA